MGRGIVCPQWRQSRDALEGKGPQSRPQRRSDRRLEEVAKSVGGGYCRIQMHLPSGRQWLGIGWAPWRVGGGGFQYIPGAEALCTLMLNDCIQEGWGGGAIKAKLVCCLGLPDVCVYSSFEGENCIHCLSTDGGKWYFGRISHCYASVVCSGCRRFAFWGKAGVASHGGGGRRDWAWACLTMLLRVQ